MLVESVNRHVAAHVRHYLVIDRRDVPMFKTLENERVTILEVESLVPWWIHRLPGVRKFWWSWRGLPMRNWILQQVVKISVANAVAEDVLLYVDSDTFFAAPYDPVKFERDGKVPLFVESGQNGLVALNDAWHNVARGLLGLSPAAEHDLNFIGNVICWRRENVLAMQRMIETTTRKNWIMALASCPTFSEYVAYGNFVTNMPEAKSGHYHDSLSRTLCYWQTKSMDQADLERFKAGLTGEHHSVMVSAKSKTPVELIRRVFMARA